VQQDLAFDTTPAWNWDMAWAQHTVDFSASGSSTVVKLSSLDISQWGPAVDSMKVELVSAGVPQNPALELARVAPDPVREGGRLTFSLATAGDARLAVYDVQGRERATLANGAFGAGPQSVAFSPRAHGLTPGLYLAVLQSGGRTLVRRFTVLD